MLIDGLVDKASINNLSYILLCVEGLFRGGEKLFFTQNKHHFDESYRIGYTGGTFLLTTSILPTSKLNTINEMLDIFKEDPNFAKIKIIANKIINNDRGFQYASKFIQKLSNALTGFVAWLLIIQK